MVSLYRLRSREITNLVASVCLSMLSRVNGLIITSPKYLSVCLCSGGLCGLFTEVVNQLLIYFRWVQRVSGTRGASQIHTDLKDPTDRHNGSIKIGDLRTQDICKLRVQPIFCSIRNLQISWVRRLQILMDPLGP